MKLWARLLLTAGAAALTAGLIVVALLLAGQHATIGQQARQIGALQTQVRRLTAGQHTTSAKLGQLSGQVAGLTVPTDPLGAFDQICNQQFTNSVTGNSQTFYLPCTDNAETIPQPGT